MRLPGSLYSHFLETNIVGTKYCSRNHFHPDASSQDHGGIREIGKHYCRAGSGARSGVNNIKRICESDGNRMSEVVCGRKGVRCLIPSKGT